MYVSEGRRLFSCQVDRVIRGEGCCQPHYVSARHLELRGHCAQMDAIDSRNAPTVQLVSPQSREDHKLESTHAIRTENHFQSLLVNRHDARGAQAWR